jgi:anti-sigma28 factor (negative regulator of flagellin synthesis)
MKIYDRNLTGTSASEAGRAQELQKTGASGSGKSGKSGSSSNDSVEFSGTLGMLSRALASSDTSRAARVQSLASQYQSGNYQPNSAATSQGMIAEALGAAAMG